MLKQIPSISNTLTRNFLYFNVYIHHLVSADVNEVLFTDEKAEVGLFSSLKALEAVQKVLDMTKKKRIDVELLERMLQELESRTLTSHSECHALRASSDSAEAGSNTINVDPLTSSDKDPVIERETEHLIQLVGKILRQVNVNWTTFLVFCFVSVVLCLEYKWPFSSQVQTAIYFFCS